MNTLLEIIDTPDDLKNLTLEDLPRLCEEIRQFLITSVQKTGGHFASNLGAIELTVALHYLFDFKQDSLIFDVSHQAYTHKLLTGRRSRFSSLRQFKGISGFTSHHESPYDWFTMAHAGTSLSNGLGISVANELQDDPSHTVVFIGDASIANGMAFEALNQIGHENRNMLVILNDNTMSIAPTVGALKTYFNQLRLLKPYLNMKKEVNQLLGRLDGPGKWLTRLFDTIRNGIKHWIIPKTIFEELGFKYFGPVDGHDVSFLVPLFQRLKNQTGPILVHAITQKGKGMEESERDPAKFHGIPPRPVACDSPPPQKIEPDDSHHLINFTTVFGETLVHMAHKYNNIIAITAAMPDGTGLLEFAKHYPKRYFDVGISEQHAVGYAAGLARKGLVPYVSIYSSFLQRSFDQIQHDLSLNNLHAVLCLDRAGLVGGDGATHNGVFDIAYTRCLPNTILMAPKDNVELKAMLEYSYHLPGIVIIRYPRDTAPNPQNTQPLEQPIELGKAELLIEGEQVALLAYGSMVPQAEAACALLQEAGINPTLVNMRFAKPLDLELLVSLLGHHDCFITLEEHNKMGGFGSAVMEGLTELDITIPVKSLGLSDEYVEHGGRSELLAHVGLDAKGIASHVRSVLSKVSIENTTRNRC
jgi:1-deoxy-D-xylulose-5-phosphate synthase